MGVALDGQVQDSQLVHRQSGNHASERPLDATAAVAAEFAADLNVGHGIEHGRVVACKSTGEKKIGNGIR